MPRKRMRLIFDIATELCYSEEVKRKIAQAKSVYEIGRILKQARLDQE